MANAIQFQSGDSVYNVKDAKAQNEISFNGLATQIEGWVNGYRIQNAGASVGEPSTNIYWRYCKIPCNPGDIFVINAKDDDWSAYRTWGFADSNNNILSYAPRGQDAVNEIIVAPANAAFMISNDYSPTSNWQNICYKNAPMGSRVSELEDAAKALPVVCKYTPTRGVAFITHCGDSLFIDCESFKLFDTVSKTYTEDIDGTFRLELSATTVRYIDYTTEGFSINANRSSNSIAYAYNRNIHPFIERIVANYRIIQPGYIRDGMGYYINFERTPIDAIFGYSDTDMKVSKKGYIFNSSGTKRYQIGDTSIPFTLQENTVNIAGKKILIIGDSFVARGYIQHFIQQAVPSVEFIGTKDTQNYGFKSEGVSGSRLYYFIDPETSPFYFDGSLNFSQYLSANGLSAPDYVVINSAINHGSYNNSEWGTYKENVVSLVNMIHTYNSNIKVYVTFGANYAITPGSDYGYTVLRYNNVRQCCNSVYDIDNITVIPVDYALIDELDYNWKTVDYFGTQLQILGDCVHPSENTGFRKIANTIYNYLGV